MFTNQKKEHPIKKKVTNELLDQLLEDYQSLEDLIGPGGLLAELKQRFITRVMDAELTTHLGYDKNEKRPAGRTNARNGHSSKHLRSDDGDLEVNVPRDREGIFEPILVPKPQRSFDSFDEAISSLYSRDLTTRDIQGHLEQMYNVEVSPTLISNLTDAVCEEVKEWQCAYCILFIRSSSLMRSWRRCETMERSPTIRFTYLWALTWRGKRKC